MCWIRATARSPLVKQSHHSRLADDDGEHLRRRRAMMGWRGRGTPRSATSSSLVWSSELALILHRAFSSCTDSPLELCFSVGQLLTYLRLSFLVKLSVQYRSYPFCFSVVGKFSCSFSLSFFLIMSWLFSRNVVSPRLDSCTSTTWIYPSWNMSQGTRVLANANRSGRSVRLSMLFRTYPSRSRNTLRLLGSKLDIKERSGKKRNSRFENWRCVQPMNPWNFLWSCVIYIYKKSPDDL